MGHDPDIPSLADPPEGDTTQSQYLHTVFIPVLFPLLPTWMHIASTIVGYVQLFPNTVSYFYSHIYHFNGCRILHHVEITPFPSVTKGSHPACLVYPRLIWFWAFCKGWVERGKTAFRWRVLEKCGHKGQQSCNSHVGDNWANALHGELQSCGKEHVSLPFIHSSAMRSHEAEDNTAEPKAPQSSGFSQARVWVLFYTLYKLLNLSEPVSPQICCKDEPGENLQNAWDGTKHALSSIMIFGFGPFPVLSWLPSFSWVSEQTHQATMHVLEVRAWICQSEPGPLTWPH